MLSAEVLGTVTFSHDHHHRCRWTGTDQAYPTWGGKRKLCFYVVTPTSSLSMPGLPGGW